MVSVEEFEAAAKEALTLPSSVGNDDKLVLYGFFKQSKEGDCTTDQPGFFDPKGKAKWAAWNANKGMDKETAMAKYVEKVNALK
eukprot:CAMPEP_0198210008 /NCGR_PEP_ID=MMETSP1445-20131203/18379_1 /TAXON_ID=36898 /ORGANISM="Pyramimonas sp., Strain CCMP2087" /LENGTH=83 /DNA_ID=CAMNT_0043883949 /DNA_START=71 /DNA_END=322 /DNA_ORIENTATION=-